MSTQVRFSCVVMCALGVVVLAVSLTLDPLPLVMAADGDLDTTFGTNGIVTTTIGNNARGWAVAMQTDGKIVVVGDSNNGTNYDFAMARYNSNGSLDTGFGTNGRVITSVGDGDDFGWSVAIQSDGKIVIVGQSNNGSDSDFAMVRYNSDGSLDTSFGTGGKVVTPVGSEDDTGRSVAIQTDGKIVVAGHSNNGNDDDFAVVRYNSDGSLDTSFGTGGKVVTPFDSDQDRGMSVAIHSDGKIVVAGHSYVGYPDIAVARYNSDGSLDTGFGTGGKVTTPIGSTADWGISVVVQDNNKTVVAGSTQISSNNNDFVVVRYDSDGTLDTSFGTDGKVITPIGGSDWPGQVVLQPDGKIVVGGYSNTWPDYDFAVARYNTTGELDTAFGSNGTVLTPIDSNRAGLGNSAAIQSDGKIIVTGYNYNGSNFEFAVVRYEAHFNLPDLSVNYDNGKPGSFFTLEGSSFPPTSTATIVVNGHTLTDTLTIDGSGDFTLLLDTSESDEGHYFVVAAVNPSATTRFELDSTAPLRAQEGSGPILSVPSGIALKLVYLPLVQR